MPTLKYIWTTVTGPSTGYIYTYIHIEYIYACVYITIIIIAEEDRNLRAEYGRHGIVERGEKNSYNENILYSYTKSSKNNLKCYVVHLKFNLILYPIFFLSLESFITVHFSKNAARKMCVGLNLSSAI